MFHAENGANVAFGDWNGEEGERIARELGNRVFFAKCDVSNWNDVLSLFDKTWKKFGVIHAVFSNAGVNTHEGLLDDHFDKETGALLPPNLTSYNINLVGTTYVTKCAIHYFNKWPETQSQIVLTASAASFFPAPPIHMYCAAKSGVLGLMRALRYEMSDRNVTINAVAPWLTGMKPPRSSRTSFYFAHGF
jgi:NAD(P)-dependent dehydrogenase (short-subunit alcohol dehydrogenase family)